MGREKGGAYGGKGRGERRGMDEKGPTVAPTFQPWLSEVLEIFENLDAKSCILVTTSCEISCFLKTTAKKLGDQYIVGPPNLKVGDQSLPVLRLLRHMVAPALCPPCPLTLKSGGARVPWIYGSSASAGYAT